jgi:hypothetical protein
MVSCFNVETVSLMKIVMKILIRRVMILMTVIDEELNVNMCIVLVYF